MPKRAARMWKRRSCQRGDSSIWSHQFEAFLSLYAATITAVGALITLPLRPITTVDNMMITLFLIQRAKKERKKERRRRKYNWTDSFICFVSISNCGSYEIFFLFLFFFCFCFLWGKTNPKNERRSWEGGRERRERVM